jgi:hypothetical protein
VSLSVDKINDMASCMMANPMMSSSTGVTDALAIIYDITDLSRYGSLTVSRCTGDGVFDRANYYGLRYFDALAAVFIAAAVNNPDLNQKLLTYTRLYGIEYPNEFEVSNMFYSSYNALSEHAIFKCSLHLQDAFTLAPPIMTNTLQSCPESFSSLISSADAYSDEGTQAASETPSLPRKAPLRRRRNREVDPILEAAGVRYAPKGVYTAGTKSFRVQLNIQSTGAKFSKNVDTLLDALWLYEIKVISADKPKSVSMMINAGNFPTLSDMQIVKSPSEYKAELRLQITRLHEADIIDDIEFEESIAAFYNMQF